jgi:uncharacterized protein YndB with AHSA1/START domain
MPSFTPQLDPKLDLMFERKIEISPEAVWTAWTTPEHLKHWFTPAPWETIDCEIDLRPGGVFSTVMRSPEGQEFPNTGCYLEVVPNQKLVWTNAFTPGFRPVSTPPVVSEEDFLFTAIISLAPHEQGTSYTARVLHSKEEDCKKHESMGYYEGWGTALDQLIGYMKQV